MFVELVLAEFALCRGNGEAPDLIDYLNRFPLYAEELRIRLMELAELLERTQLVREPESSRSEPLKPGFVSHPRNLASNAESRQTRTRQGFRNRPRPLPASCLFHP